MARRLETPSRIVTKSLSTVYTEYMESGKLDLSPPYQRAPCWTHDQNCGLIDSIMNNWPIPMFTIYKLSMADPSFALGARFECVDGQNRLRAIAAFRSGTPIPNKKGVDEYVYWTRPTDMKELKWTDLSDEERSWFNDYDVAVNIIQASMTMESRKAMFTSLQDGTRISASENLKNSMHPVSQFTSRTGLRDFLEPVLNGLMTASTQWIDVIADCASLWLHRDDADPLASLNRKQNELRRVLGCKKNASRNPVYKIELEAAHDATLFPLFESLVASLTEVKRGSTVRCHKFYVSLLFLYITLYGEAPPTEIIREWFASMTSAKIVAEGKAGKRDYDIYKILWNTLMHRLVDIGASGTDGKPKRHTVPKQKRNEVWTREFPGSTDGVCPCCEAPITVFNMEVAHIQAVADGGTNDATNLIPTCGPCNRSCGSEHLVSWCEREYPTAPLLRR